jgi:hypothetical protein
LLFFPAGFGFDPDFTFDGFVFALVLAVGLAFAAGFVFAPALAVGLALGFGVGFAFAFAFAAGFGVAFAFVVGFVFAPALAVVFGVAFAFTFGVAGTSPRTTLASSDLKLGEISRGSSFSVSRVIAASVNKPPTFGMNRTGASPSFARR